MRGSSDYQLLSPSKYRNTATLQEHISLWQAGIVRFERLADREFDRIKTEHAALKERRRLKNSNCKAQVAARPDVPLRRQLRSVGTVGLTCKGKIHTPEIIESSDVEDEVDSV